MREAPERPRGRHAADALRFASLSLLLCALTACDPCAGTLACSRSPFVAVAGQIVDESSGTPVSNVRVQLTQTGGPNLRSPSVTTTTGSDGIFELEASATDLNDVVVTLSVATPGKPAYDVPDLRLRPSTATGTATVLEPWVSAHPMFPYVLIVNREGTFNGVANASVSFQRTAGPLLLANDTVATIVRGTTDQSGWLYLLRGITADRAGVVTGDLTIVTPSAETLFLPQVTWTAMPRFHHPTIVVVVGVPSP